MASPTSRIADVRQWNEQVARYTLTDLLRWAADTFGDRLVQVTSFAPAGVVILDHLVQVAPQSRVLTVDTGFLFAETYALWAAIEQRYDIRLDVVAAGLSPAKQTEFYGPRLWEIEPDVCCHVRKVAPLDRALAGNHAWIAGLRRDQSAARAGIDLVEWDMRHQQVKLNPLAHWTRDRVWHYLRSRDLPYNRLHDAGYASIGCTHCTRPSAQSDDERAGRWQGEVKTECGLHSQIGRSV